MKINEQLNEFILSEAWQMVKGKFEEKIRELDSLKNINTTLTAELQLIQIEANKKAIELIESVLQDINGLAKAEAVKKKIML